MKSPCEHLAGRTPALTPAPAPFKEDPRIHDCRVELHAFIKEVTTLIDNRLLRLSEILQRGDRAMVEEIANSELLTFIAKQTAASFKVDVDYLYSPRRREFMVVPRQAAMYLARRLTTFSLNEIGEHFGGRDHGTVLHAVRATTNRIDSDPHFNYGLEQLEARLKTVIGPRGRALPKCQMPNDQCSLLNDPKS